MRTYELTLKCDAPTDFYCLKAAASVDLNIEKKLTHHMKVRVDLETPYNIGLIIGNSGSGKSTLSKHIWGNDCFETLLNHDLAVISQFDENYSYDERVSFLTGVGLGSPATWIAPAKTLSNGQQSRAEVALQMARKDEKFIVIDEFTSVVDRTVAKAMAHSVQKVARKMNKQIVLLSCHYDIVDWLNPDWIIDCNTQDYIDRRLKCPGYTRTEELVFGIRQLTDKKSWSQFSKYHYLTDTLPPGKTFMFGLFHENTQIGFVAYSNYVLWKQEHKDKGIPMMFHANRIVILPDYCGFGLGGRFTDATADYMKNTLGYEVQIKLSSVSMANLLKRNDRWQLNYVKRDLDNIWKNHEGRQGRQYVKTYSFEFLG